MRIRSRKNLEKKNTAIVLLFLLPVIGFATYAIGILAIIDDMASFTYELDPPDTSKFYSLDEINDTILADMARTFEDRWWLYHSPNNISVDTIFTNSNYDTPESYVPTDNGGQWTGMMLAAECYRYGAAKAEGNQTEMDGALQLIKRMVDCFSSFLAAPNGGIGPDYPGIPARFVAAPGEEDLFPFMYDDEYLHYNGTAPYDQWRVRLHTSLDEMAGYIMGLGGVLKYVTPEAGGLAEWCNERTRLLTAQIIEGFKSTNWKMITGDGTPCGTDLDAYLGGGIWKLSYLKMGAIAYPEIYTSEYAYVASKMMYKDMTSEGSAWNTIMDYYAYAFSVCVQFTLINLEENEYLRNYYIKQYEDQFYPIVRYHRNAFKNIAHLIFMEMLGDTKRTIFANPDYTDSNIRHDVLDQLWRFHATGWCPMRNYNLIQRPHSTRSTSLDPAISAKIYDPTPQKWSDFFENNIFGKLFSWIDIEFNFDDHYLLPLTVSEIQMDALIWEENPFYGEGGNPTGNGLREGTGMSYLVVYWMGRAFGIF